MNISFTLEKIKEIVGSEANVSGNTNTLITNVNSLSESKSGDLSFLSNSKYKSYVPLSDATTIILPEDFEGSPKPGQVFIKVKNPSWAFALICSEIERSLRSRPKPGIHATAIIADDVVIPKTTYVGPYSVIESGAKIGENCVLMGQLYIGHNVQIGDNCDIMPHVNILDYTVVGNRVRIHNGVVLGADGFGYSTINGVHEKEPQIGIVEIADDVEIGANTCIDRARFSKTTIGKGTKIDNLVQIGHNCKIGRGCLIVSQVGISGSSIIEDYVVLAGQVGVAGHLTIGKGAMVAAQGGVNSSVEAGLIVQGTPVEPISLMKKIDVLKRKLPELFKRVANLEEIVESYKAQISK